MNTNGHTIYKCDLCQVWQSSYTSFTRIGNTYTCICISGLANTLRPGVCPGQYRWSRAYPDQRIACRHNTL